MSENHGPDNPRPLKQLLAPQAQQPPHLRTLWIARHQQELVAAQAADQEKREKQIQKQHRKRMDEDAERKAKEEMKKAETASPGATPLQMPNPWIMDGGWAKLSNRAKAVVPVVYAILEAAGKRKKAITYKTIAAMAGVGEKTVSRAVKEAAERGWFSIRQRAYARRGIPLTRTEFELPPWGRRRDKVEQEAQKKPRRSNENGEAGS